MLLTFSGRPLFAGIIVLVMIVVFLYRRKRNFSYLLCITIFGIYLLGVIHVVLFPIYIPLSSVESQLPFTPSMNLVPFYFRCASVEICLREILGNIFLTVPFGFGLPFIVRLKARDFFWLASAVGLTLEGIQLALSLALRSSFRAVDINDVLLNALGVGLGYGLFRAFGWGLTALFQRLHKNPQGLLSYMLDMVRNTTP